MWQVLYLVHNDCVPIILHAVVLVANSQCAARVTLLSLSVHNVIQLRVECDSHFYDSTEVRAKSVCISRFDTEFV